MLNEFYRVAFRKKVYRSTDDLQAYLDAWIKEYNEARAHQGHWCFGKTPMQPFLDAMPMTKEKMIAAYGNGHLNLIARHTAVRSRSELIHGGGA